MSELLTIPGLLAAQAGRTPEAVALLAPGRASLTYGGLHRHVTETAARLNSLGVGRGDRVAIVLPNGPEMATAFLSVASGATAAPLNPAYRVEEFDFCLADLRAKALIAQAGVESAARAAAKSRGIPLVELSPATEAEAGRFSLDGAAPAGPARAEFAGPQDVALVLHTSGTTSRPKLVPLTQANLCVSAENIRRSLALTAGDRCLNVMPLFHVHGLMAALMASLAAGGSAVCTPGFDAARFFEWMDGMQPTWFTAVPTMHQAVLERAGAHGGLIARRRLRFIRSCSSALPPVLMAELERAFDAPVIEAYGMTEASHQMASNPLPPRARKPGSVGVAAGPEVAIMDESGKLLPPGATGEIVIRGRNVTAGYESNPDANQKAFTNGWFRTGDQGCMDADGYVFLTGRLKELINRGGEKIAPREVDEALLAHPAVAQAVAFALPHATLGETVAAAVVLRTGASAGEEDLRTFAAGRLAEFKVPGRVLILDAIPKGPTGKPQRIGLADKLAAHLKTAFAEPRTETERFLAETWRSALNGARAGLYDNFFDLGGNSLLAAQVVARVRKKLGVRLELRDLSLQTLGQLAALCEQRRQERTPARGGLRAKLLKKLTRSSP